MLIKKLIINNRKGVYNVGARDSISKKDFAVLYAKKLGKKIYFNEISARNDDLNRPLNLTLNVHKVEKSLKTKMISSNQVVKKLVKYKI